MRTNINIDDQLMANAKELSGLKTKTSVIDEALKNYVRLLHQKALAQLAGKLKWEGNLDQMRTDK